MTETGAARSGMPHAYGSTTFGNNVAIFYRACGIRQSKFWSCRNRLLKNTPQILSVVSVFARDFTAETRSSLSRNQMDGWNTGFNQPAKLAERV
jgi:hypothetical protein